MALDTYEGKAIAFGAKLKRLLRRAFARPNVYNPRAQNRLPLRRAAKPVRALHFRAFNHDNDQIAYEPIAPHITTHPSGRWRHAALAMDFFPHGASLILERSSDSHAFAEEDSTLPTLATTSFRSGVRIWPSRPYVQRTRSQATA